MIEKEGAMNDIPIVGLHCLEKERLLGSQRLIILDKMDFEFCILVDHENNKVHIYLNEESNIRVAWILRLLKQHVTGKKGSHCKYIFIFIYNLKIFLSMPKKQKLKTISL